MNWQQPAKPPPPTPTDPGSRPTGGRVSSGCPSFPTSAGGHAGVWRELPISLNYRSVWNCGRGGKRLRCIFGPTRRHERVAN